ncbi:MAG: GNAT family N-acetyltransferase, partial [Pseudomonadota bacterium]
MNITLKESSEVLSAHANVAAGSALEKNNSAPYDIVVSDSFPDAKVLWKSLQMHGLLSPFQDYEWVKSWLDSFSGANRPEPILVHLYKGKRLVGLLPLCKTRSFGSTIISWMADSVSDTCVPLLLHNELEKLSQEAIQTILDRVAMELSNVDLYLLRYQPISFDGIENPFAKVNQQIVSGESHQVGIEQPWLPFYQTLRSSKTRSRLRQKWRKLSKRGHLSFRSVRDPADQKDALDQILSWKSDQLNQRGSRNPFFTGGGHPSRLTQTLQSYLNHDAQTDSGSLRIFGLFLNGELIAGYATFVEPKRFSVFVNAYAPDSHSDCSPGLLLLVRLLELSSRSGRDVLDLMRGAEDYKKDWCSDCTLLVNNLYPITWRGRLYGKAHR